MKIKNILLIVQILISCKAFAFNGDEHKKLGDMAFKVAFNYLSLSCEGGFKEACALIGSKEVESYGDIVERIDYMISPNMMFTQIGEDVSYPRSYKELNPSFFGDYKSIDDSYLRSSHNNEAHFQGYLLFNLHDWHRRAINLAEKEKNIFSALIANAVSDHYLHDFFAPGHITTARFNFHDSFALGMHDINNELGAKFIIHDWDKLEPILIHLMDNNSNYKFDHEVLSDLMNNHDYIYLHGDGGLDKNPKQFVFMLLVEVDSIVRVIKCFQNNERCNVSDESTYSWETTTLERVNSQYKLTPPIAEIKYGKYEIDVLNTKLYSPVVGVSISQETLFLDEGQYRWGANFEFVPFGVPGSPDFVRKKYTLEPLTNLNWGPALGYQFMEAEYYSAKGPQLRLILSRPQIELQYGAYVRYLKYESDFSNDKALAYGIRSDIGFSLVTLSLSMGKDHGYTSEGIFESDVMLSFGITISAPFSRVPGLNIVDRKLTGRSGRRLPNN